MKGGRNVTEFERIYNQYFRDVHSFVLSLSRNEKIAEEITQETFFKALKSIDKFKGNCKINVWLCQIAKNTYFTYLDKQKRYDTDDIPEEISENSIESMIVNEIKNVSELADSKIVYYAEINDGYSLNRIKYDMDKEGNFYITPLRPIIKQEAQPLNGLEKRYDFIDIKEQELVRGKEIKKIYYGTPKDKILIWEKGMDLPKASEEIENMFHFE